MLQQLNPPIPLTTPKGDGFAHFIIDYSQEHHLHWVVFLNDTGECWTFSNPEVRIQKNYSLGRNSTSPLNQSISSKSLFDKLGPVSSL